MKKLIALTVLLAFLFTFTALAEDSGLRLMEAKQIEGTKDLRFYISSNTPPAEEDLTIYMDDAPIDAELELQPASETAVGVVYVFCLDISGSIDNRDLNTAKAYLLDFCDNLGENDLMRVYTIGDTASPLTGYTRDHAEVENALNSIKERTNNTFLWESIRMAANDLKENSETLPMLSQLIVFSDGVEDSKGAGCSVKEALESVNDAGAPLRVVLINSIEQSKEKKKAGREGIDYLTENSGGVLIEPKNKNFAAGLEELGTIIGNDYCLIAKDLPYDFLTGEKQCYVEQRLADGSVVRSNTMTCKLSQDGLYKPVKNLTIYVNDEAYTGDTLQVDRSGGVTVKVEADGKVNSYNAKLTAGETEINSYSFGENEPFDMSGVMRYGVDYTLTVEATPMSDESGQTLTAEAVMTPKAFPVTSLDITVNGQSAKDKTIAVEQDSSVTFSWTADGDIRDYDIAVSADGVAIDALNTSDTEYTCANTDWELGKVYTFDVTVNSFSDEEGQALSASTQLSLVPIDVTSLEVELVGVEKAEDGVYLIPKDAVAQIKIIADGDVKSCTYKLNGNEITPAIDASTLELGELYYVIVNVEPWSTNEGQKKDAVTVAVLKPDEITGFGLTVDGAEAGDNVIYVDRETGLDAEVTVSGDVKDITVTGPEQISVAQDFASLTLTNQNAAVGDVYELTVAITPYDYGTVAEGVETERTYSIALKPLPVTSLSLFVDGNQSEVTGGQATVSGDAALSWTVNGDAKEYIVTLPDGSTETLTDTAYTVANSQLSPTQEYNVKVEAVPYEGESVSASVGIFRTGIPLSNAVMFLNDEPLDLETAKVELDEEPDVLRVEVDGEARNAEFSFINKDGEIRILESNNFFVSINADSMGDAKSGEIRALLIPIDQSNETVTLTLPVTKKGGVNIALIAAIAGVVAMLAALLIILLVRRSRKKKIEEKRLEDRPLNDTAKPYVPVPESQMPFSNAVEIGYRQEVKGEDTVTMKHIVRGKAQIGREQGSEILFNGGSLWEQTISRKHALLTVDDDFRLFIAPIAAKNETKVDGTAITAPTEVKAGSVIEMGDVRWTITRLVRLR